MHSRLLSLLSFIVEIKVKDYCEGEVDFGIQDIEAVAAM